MPEKRANWIYLFHGEDELSSREAVQGLITRMKDSPMWEFNVATFDGGKLILSELMSTCQTVPFMADRRMVVVTNLISHLATAPSGSSREDAQPGRSSRGGKKVLLDELLGFLPTVPEFCRLVFLEGQLILDRDPVLRSIQTQGGFVKAYRLEERGLVGWIRDRARKAGCGISPEAVDELAAAVGPNARLLNGEIVKLATYCQDRSVGFEDVRALVGDARKANVFTMVDALGRREPGVALQELRRLLSEGDHPMRVVAMVIRQFRLLIQVKEMSEAGASPDEIVKGAGVPFRGVTKLQLQARNFSFPQLERAYRQLLDFDIQVKTGAREPEAALELLIMELVRAA